MANNTRVANDGPEAKDGGQEEMQEYQPSEVELEQQEKVESEFEDEFKKVFEIIKRNVEHLHSPLLCFLKNGILKNRNKVCKVQ